MRGAPGLGPALRGGRAAASRLVKPAVQPFFDRVEARVRPVDERVAGLAEASDRMAAELERLAARVAALEGRLPQVEAHLPYLRNAITTENAGARRVREELDDLARRLDALERAGRPEQV